MKNYFIILFVLLPITVFAQTERYTKGAENGYSWISMEDPSQHYSTSKETYLSGILDRYRLTQEKHPEIASLSCREDMEKLAMEGKSDNISLEDVVEEINVFYSRNDNMIVPIIFAYCYTIKKLAGMSMKELNSYKEEVLLFCEE
jgi:hypothetical protein